jgi:hypothetical protein
MRNHGIADALIRPPARMIQGAIPDTFRGLHRGVEPMVTASLLDLTPR